MIVNIRLGPINGLVGYVAVEGEWAPSASASPQAWRTGKAALFRWKEPARAVRRAWQEKR